MQSSYHQPQQGILGGVLQETQHWEHDFFFLYHSYTSSWIFPVDALFRKHFGVSGTNLPLKSMHLFNISLSKHISLAELKQLTPLFIVT